LQRNSFQRRPNRQHVAVRFLFIALQQICKFLDIFSFASRASTIKLDPHLNEIMDDATLLKRHAKRIRELEHDIKVIQSYF